MFDDSEYTNYEEAKSEGREEGEYVENVQSIKQMQIQVIEYLKWFSESELAVN